MIDHYRSWLQKKPDDRLALYGLAFELKKRGEVEASRTAFERLLALHPTSGAGWFQFGQLFEDEGEEEEAIRVWREGLSALDGVDSDDARRSRAEILSAIDALA